MFLLIVFIETVDKRMDNVQFYVFFISASVISDHLKGSRAILYIPRTQVAHLVKLIITTDLVVSALRSVEGGNISNHKWSSMHIALHYHRSDMPNIL